MEYIQTTLTLYRVRPISNKTIYFFKNWKYPKRLDKNEYITNVYEINLNNIYYIIVSYIIQGHQILAAHFT